MIIVKCIWLLITDTAVTLSDSDEDCILISEPSDNETEEEEEDPNNSGMHTNDTFNVPDDEGRVLVNLAHDPSEPDIFLAPQISRIIKPHQVSFYTRTTMIGIYSGRKPSEGKIFPQSYLQRFMLDPFFLNLFSSYEIECHCIATLWFSNNISIIQSAAWQNVLLCWFPAIDLFNIEHYHNLLFSAD